MSTLKIGLLLTLTAICSFSSGCAPEQSAAEISKEIASRKFEPRDPDIAAIYNRSCRSCHTIAATGAPLTGDTERWSVRRDKGMDTLVDNVVNGFGGMPPLGMCMDCESVEFEALITFMAQPNSDGGTQNP